MSPDLPPYAGEPEADEPREGYDVNRALGYGWTRLQDHPGPLLLAGVAVVAGIAVLQVLGLLVGSALGGEDTAQYGYDPATRDFGSGPAGGALLDASFGVSLLFVLAAIALALVLHAGLVRAALDITAGRAVTVRGVLTVTDLPQVLLTAVVLATATTVGLVLCLLPGLVVWFLTGFTLFFLVDRRLSPLEAVKASVAFTLEHLGPLAALFATSLLAYFAGAVLCGVGLVAAIPVVVLAQAYTYRVLREEPVTDSAGVPR